MRRSDNERQPYRPRFLRRSDLSPREREVLMCWLMAQEKWFELGREWTRAYWDGRRGRP